MVFSVKLDDSLENQLIVLARKTGQTKTFHINKALAGYIKSKLKVKLEKNNTEHWSLDDIAVALNLEE